MRFVFSAVYVALKRSVSVILCAIISLSMIAAVFSAALPISKYEPIKVALINRDDSEMMLPLVVNMLESRLGGLVKAELMQSDPPAGQYAAVLVLPKGFFESVMNGENLAPQLTVNASSSFEGVWIGSLAKCAASVISNAQNAVGAVNAAAIDAGMSSDERDKVIMSLNAHLLNDYLTRKGRFESVTLSAGGNISVGRHYISAAASFFCFIAAFLLFAPINELKTFAIFSQKKVGCLISAVINCAILAIIVTATAAASVGTAHDIFSVGFIRSALLLFSVLLFFPSVTNHSASCAALCCGSCLFQAVFGGAVLPEALLPDALATASRFFPMSVFRKSLADTVYHCGFSDCSVLFGWCLLLTVLSILCWLRREEKP